MGPILGRLPTDDMFSSTSTQQPSPVDVEPESESFTPSSPKDARKQIGKRKNMNIGKMVVYKPFSRRWQCLMVLLLKSATAY